MKYFRIAIILVILGAAALTGSCFRRIDLAEPTNNEEEEVVKGEYKKITPAEALDMMNGDVDVIILDVRGLDEYVTKHIPGAVQIPDNELEKTAPDALPDKDAVILVYCRSGRRSEASSKKLVEMGYTAVYDFGGIMDWPYETEEGTGE